MIHLTKTFLEQNILKMTDFPMKTLLKYFSENLILRIFKSKIIKWPNIFRRAVRISNSTNSKLTTNMYIVRLSKPHTLYFSSNPFRFEGHCVLKQYKKFVLFLKDSLLLVLQSRYSSPDQHHPHHLHQQPHHQLVHQPCHCHCHQHC